MENKYHSDKNISFIQRAKEIHGDNIDFSKTEYVKSSEKVCLICHKKDKNGIEHGEYWQTPSDCLRGKCCPKCANERRGPKNEDRLDTSTFINRAKEVHGDKYSYEKTIFFNSNTKIIITCKKHGDFEQMPHAHLNGQGCPKCAGRSWSFDNLLSEFRKIHGGKYDYSKFVYVNKTTKGIIICPEHGEFLQSPNKHLLGRGCPVCGNKRKNKNRKTTFGEYVERANKVHCNKYSYLPTEIENLHDKITISCPKHGFFEQLAYDHLNGHGCPTCGLAVSNAENEIFSFIQNELGISDAQQRCRDVIPPMELDIYIPSHQIAIEYNGLIWHSEKFKSDSRCHLDKLNRCIAKGIKLITIFEDEYLEHKEIVLEKIRHLLNCNDKPKIYARKCEIVEIDKDLARNFLNKNHIQGYVPSSICLGVFHDGELVSVMTFRHDKGGWVLSRCATDITKHCVGVCSKMLQYFIRTYNPVTIKSFADLRWTIDRENNLYTHLGFKLTDVLPPDYSYVTNKGKRVHKFNFRKKRILQNYNDIDLSSDMSESQMAKTIGIYKIWNCGLLKFVWNK